MQLYFRLPTDLQGDSFKLGIQLGEGKMIQDIPLVPVRLAVDFFPEGGELVAGVPNRVYYRVRSAGGEPVSQEGHLTLAWRSDEIASSFQQGLGSFVFTPDPAEMYTIRLTSAAGDLVAANPFQALGIQGEGVVLHVPDSVGKEGEPIRVQLRQRGAARRVLLLVECRGQMVDEQWIQVAAPETTVELKPAAGARGVLRVTAYEAQGSSWQPLAERLVYRSPAGQLQLDLAAAPAPGPTWRGRVLARDEKGAPTSACVLAAVVDEKYRTPEVPLDSHFYLLGAVRTGLDVEDIPLVATDSAQAREQLDLFLGTHGWRRFVRKDMPALAQLNEKGLRVATTSVAAPALFSRENVRLEELRQQVQVRVDAETKSVQAQAERDLRRLDEEKQLALAAQAQALQALAEYDRLPWVYLRLGLGMLLCALLVVGVLLLLAGLVRLLRRSPQGSPAFAAAFVCMLLGVGLSVVVLNLEPPTAPPPVRLSQAAPPSLVLPRSRPLPATEQQAAPLPPAGALAEPMVNPRDEPRNKQDPIRLEADTAAGRRLEMTAAAKRVSAPVQTLSRGGVALRDADGFAARNPVQQRNQGAGIGGMVPGPVPMAPGGGPKPLAAPARGGPATAPAAAPSAKAETAKMAEELHGSADRAESLRELRYRQTAAQPTDTLLWLPALWLEHGTAALDFDLPVLPASYRLLLFGHNATGRLGFYQNRLDVPATVP
jgi:hypothetical protein